MNAAAWVLLLAAQESDVDYFRDVRPLLSVHCWRCHSHEAVKGGLRLDDRALALKGGDSGPALVPGKPDESLLLKLVTTADKAERMPAKAEALTPKEVDVLRRWIAAGAPWPDASELAHWAFRPLPKADGALDIDRHVHAGLRGLRPAPPAERRTLIRRVTLDLTGLPPSPEELASAETYEQAVDRLLASPHYGERWGRHWLDFARWAETSGFEANALRPTAWRYRDYVVASLNADKPYDRFLREQLAGDELLPTSDEALVATGFLAGGRLDVNQEDRAQQRNDHLVDIVNAVSSVALGLQMACAQCHDHKWDPLTQADYYRLQGFFVRGQVANVVLQDPAGWAAHRASVPPELEPSREYRKLLTAGKKPPEEDKKLLEELDKKIKALEAKVVDKPHAWAYYSPATGAPGLDVLPLKGMYPMPWQPDALRKAQPRLLRRGDVHLPADPLEPGWPAVLGPVPASTSTRAQLADWLLRPEHPLTWRVAVNFVWLRHFGRGLVPTPADFGLRGAPPTHPGLLDALAADFAAHRSLKRLHRAIVLSAAYRRSARPDPDALKADPDNRLLWRWTPRRLEAEAIRDSMLAVSGELKRDVGGPSVDEEPQGGKGPKLAVDPFRRTLYLAQRRNEFPRVQELFDGPQAGESCAKRFVSTVSLQPLYLLNSRFSAERARALEARCKGDRATAFRFALGRAPEPAELAAAEKLDLFTLCHSLFNLNEFVYVE
jgi:mono/diheme cytochrome c family protein